VAPREEARRKRADRGLELLIREGITAQQLLGEFPVLNAVMRACRASNSERGAEIMADAQDLLARMGRALLEKNGGKK
jgi:hypothetical protein